MPNLTNLYTVDSVAVPVQWNRLTNCMTALLLIHKFNENIKLMFLSIGSEERPERVKAFAEALQGKGLQNVVYYESPGSAHEWLTWRRSLREFAPLIFK